VRPLFLVLALIVGALFTTQASEAQSHGPLLMGRVIDTTHPFHDATGNCSCNWQWYTIGVRPGTLRIVATLHSYAGKMAPTWAIRVVLLQGKHQVKVGQAACLATHTSCNQSVTLTTRVSRSTIYYVEVEGPGASQISYTMRFAGALFQLHCGRYC